MIYDGPRGRYLTRDGFSIVSEYQAARQQISGQDLAGYPLESEGTRLYEYYTGLDSQSIKEEQVTDTVDVPNKEHTKDQLDYLLSVIVNSDRMTNKEEEYKRIELEIDYFERTKNIIFLLNVVDLVKKFREDNVVWGVGRGSSCSSYVLYLIGVNDINPLLFDIPFSELSKE